MPSSSFSVSASFQNTFERCEMLLNVVNVFRIIKNIKIGKDTHAIQWVSIF